MNKQKFTASFKEKVKDLDHEEVIRVLKISRTTFYRWMNGDSAPHRFGREAVFKVL